MKLVFVCPHLSTGGMPQYTLKMIEEFKKTMEISVVEVRNYSNEYTVQRKRIQALVPVKQLFGDQDMLKPYLEKINPDIVHCQERPEDFLNPKNLQELYSNRTYNIVVTTHSSLTKGSDFRYLPDRIVTVNQWQRDLFKRELPDTEIDMWEYPIENKKVSRSQILKARELIPGFPIDRGTSGCGVTHILNVGLFTPGKNQGELFEIARRQLNSRDECYYCYHFVGNQPPNEDFKPYWEALMKNKPANCIVWGERSDVDLFYQACDEMWFTSKFELNPLCVREALSYGMPVKMRRLPTYGTQYDNNPLVTYTDFKTNK